jgi:hypothetical protein
MIIEGSGIYINVAEPFNVYAADWADQLSTYLWLEGEAVGSQAICIVHQLACKGSSEIRVADLRGRIEADYQESLFNDYVNCWEDVKYWKDERLERVADQFCGTSLNDTIFMEMTR